MVTSEKSPKRAGVVRRMARSDHWRCVSTRHLGSHFVKGDFDWPTHDKPCQNLHWISVLIRTQHSLGSKSALWITNEHPANGDRRNASMIPQRRAGRHL